MQTAQFNDSYGQNRTGKSYNGEVEIIVKDKCGRIISHSREDNIVKIFAKEILSHRMIHNKVWDPDAGSGAGAWVSSGIDQTNDFAVKYIIFGASFDNSGAPLSTSDTRYYVQDIVTGAFVPIKLSTGAAYGGDLINPIPINEPINPLKRIERIYFEPSYQPAGTPLLQDDVRAVNNVVVMETTLRKDEYNGFGYSGSDKFTITEIALVAGEEFDSVGACDKTPAELFRNGRVDGSPITVNMSGTATVSIDSSDSIYTNVIKEGDQVVLVDIGGTSGTAVEMTNNSFLVINKSDGGSDIVLDRIPVDTNGDPITGQMGIFRSTLRIFSHRILNVPFEKSSDFEILVRWRITMN